MNALRDSSASTCTACSYSRTGNVILFGGDRNEKGKSEIGKGSILSCCGKRSIRDFQLQQEKNQAPNTLLFRIAVIGQMEMLNRRDSSDCQCHNPETDIRVNETCSGSPECQAASSAPGTLQHYSFPGLRHLDKLQNLVRRSGTKFESRTWSKPRCILVGDPAAL
jgi:hypothetical protein